MRFSLLIAEDLSRNAPISRAGNRFHSPRGPLCRHMDLVVNRFGAMRHGISSQRESFATESKARGLEGGPHTMSETLY